MISKWVLWEKGVLREGRGLFYTNFFIPFTGVPCYKRIPEASQWPDKSAGASLSICLRGMSAGKCPDTENLFSQCANLTDEIPCWSYSTVQGLAWTNCHVPYLGLFMSNCLRSCPLLGLRRPTSSQSQCLT